jgi:hypothetical protein
MELIRHDGDGLTFSTQLRFAGAPASLGYLVCLFEVCSAARNHYLECDPVAVAYWHNRVIELGRVISFAFATYPAPQNPC